MIPAIGEIRIPPVSVCHHVSTIEECKKSGEPNNLRPLLKEILIMMHPFAPFITEEIHSLLFDSSII